MKKLNDDVTKFTLAYQQSSAELTHRALQIEQLAKINAQQSTLILGLVRGDHNPAKKQQLLTDFKALIAADEELECDVKIIASLNLMSKEEQEQIFQGDEGAKLQTVVIAKDNSHPVVTTFSITANNGFASKVPFDRGIHEFHFDERSSFMSDDKQKAGSLCDQLSKLKL